MIHVLSYAVRLDTIFLKNEAEEKEFFNAAYPVIGNVHPGKRDWGLLTHGDIHVHLTNRNPVAVDIAFRDNAISVNADLVEQVRVTLQNVLQDRFKTNVIVDVIAWK